MTETSPVTHSVAANNEQVQVWLGWPLCAEHRMCKIVDLETGKSR